MSHTQARIIQYIALIFIFASLGGVYWYWKSAQASTQKAATKTGLVAYWSFDEGSGTGAGDASGNGNTGTLTNGPTWVDGKFGKAINFDGINDYVQSSVFSAIPSSVTVSAWIKSNSAGGGVVDELGNGGGWTIQNLKVGTDNVVQACMWIGSVSCVNAGTAVSYNVWHHVVMRYSLSGTTLTGFVDGVQGDSTVATKQWPSSGLYYSVGRGTGAGGLTYFSGVVDDVRIYNRVLTSTEITTLYNLGAAKLNASKNTSLTDGLVGLWSFDGADVSGTTAYDRSGSGNNGTLTGGPTAAIGKIGQGLSFDGGNDYVNTNYAPNWTTASDFSFSFWYKSNETSYTADRDFISRFGDSPFPSLTVEIDGDASRCADNTIIFSVSDDNNTTVDKACSSLVANDTNWHHVAGAYDVDGLMYLWIDNSLQATVTVTNSNGNKNFVTNPLYIGAHGDNVGTTSEFFNGTIDDFRIYNRALSATEIQSLYYLGDADKINSSVSQAQGTGRFDSGLQSYWPLDENTGTTTTDASTNAATGTLTLGPAWTTGQIGYGVDFDGTDDYITTPDADTLDIADSRNFVLSGWFNRDTFTTDDTIVAKSNGQTAADTGYTAYIDDATDKLTFVANDGTDQYKLESVSTFTATGWHHFTLVWNDSVSTETKLYIDGAAESATATGTFANVNSLANALTFNLGAESDAGNPFDGKIDEMRLYNRALSADEVAQAYRLTTPTGVDTGLKGYWSFNGPDLSGTTAYDRSGAGNTGTLTGGPTAAIGKIGQGLSFDGVDDYVDVADNASLSPTSQIAVSFWVKRADPNASGRKFIVNKGTCGNIATCQYWFEFTGANTGITFDIADSDDISDHRFTTTQTITDTNWHHVVGTFNGNIQKVYIDGAQDATTLSWTGSINTTNSNFNIGRLSQGLFYFPGSIDDVRIYNRTLSASEANALYNSGR